jgi:hypothetical protein
MMTSPIVAGSMSARAIASRITIAPSFDAGTSLSEPPNDPMGVRHALRMTVGSFSTYTF